MAASVESVDAAPAGRPLQLHREPVSFQARFDQELEACRTALLGPMKVRGAEACLRQAYDRFQSLGSFDEAVERHLRDGTLTSLSPVRDKLERRIRYVVRLDCGDFLGFFLLSPTTPDVVALLFARRSEPMLDRLDELAARHREAPSSSAVFRREDEP